MTTCSDTEWSGGEGGRDLGREEGRGMGGGGGGREIEGISLDYHCSCISWCYIVVREYLESIQ